MAKELILLSKEKYDLLVGFRGSNIISPPYSDMQIQSSNPPASGSHSSNAPDNQINNSEDMIELMKDIARQNGTGVRGKLMKGPPGKRPMTFNWLPY